MDLEDEINISDDQNNENESQETKENINEQPVEDEKDDTALPEFPTEPDEMEGDDENEGEDAMQTSAAHDGGTGEHDGDEEQDESKIDPTGMQIPEHHDHEAFGVRSKDGLDGIKDQNMSEEDSEEEDNHVSGSQDQNI